jgi:predicted SPOUT superfamily RNA methylase MTH1
MSSGGRVTIKIVRTSQTVEVKPADHNAAPSYWGYTVTLTKNPLAESTRRIGFDLVISTSRYGNSISEVLPNLQSTWAKSNKILVAFGSPTRGLKEILKHEGLDLNDYADFIVNTIPDQGVETVRTEEAIYTSLSILNILG